MRKVCVEIYSVHAGKNRVLQSSCIQEDTYNMRRRLEEGYLDVFDDFFTLGNPMDFIMKRSNNLEILKYDKYGNVVTAFDIRLYTYEEKLGQIINQHVQALHELNKEFGLVEF